MLASKPVSWQLSNQVPITNRTPDEEVPKSTDWLPNTVRASGSLTPPAAIDLAKSFPARSSYSRAESARGQDGPPQQVIRPGPGLRPAHRHVIQLRKLGKLARWDGTVARWPKRRPASRERPAPPIAAAASAQG